MFVGVLKLTFHIPHARSLKDKRSVVRKFRDRVRARFDVSIAEVDAQDSTRGRCSGWRVVSGEAAVCDSVLENVARAAETQEEAVLTRPRDGADADRRRLYGDEADGDEDDG